MHHAASPQPRTACRTLGAEPAATSCARSCACLASRRASAGAGLEPHGPASESRLTPQRHISSTNSPLGRGSVVSRLGRHHADRAALHFHGTVSAVPITARSMLGTPVRNALLVELLTATLAAPDHRRPVASVTTWNLLHGIPPTSTFARFASTACDQALNASSRSSRSTTAPRPLTLYP